MEKLAKKLANNIAESLGYDSEKEKVIAYGLIAMIQIAVTVILVLIIGLVARTPVESLIICFSVSALRKYSGGAHAGFIEECTTISVIYCLMCSLISKYLLLSVLNIYWLSTLTIIIYALSYYAIYKLAPVDSTKKPIKTEKKKKRMRRGSFVTLSVYCALSILFVILGIRYHYINSFAISLLFGVVWQIFTLTKTGTYFLNIVDFAVTKACSIGQEVHLH